MAIGTTTNYNEDRFTVITDAMFLLGVNAAGESIADADMQLGIRFLNRLVKQWQAQGIHVWTNSYATLFFEQDEPLYVLGNETQAGAHWAEAPIVTDLDADALAAATTLTFETTAGMIAGDHIGIVDNDSAIQWTTIDSVTNGTTIVLDSALLTASNSGNVVYVYTERPSSGCPLRVLDANITQGVGQQTSTVLMPGLAFEDFFQLTNKLTPGTPVNWNYQKDVNTGTVRVWPVPNDASFRMSLHYTRPIFNFDLTTSDQDLPQEWLQALIYQLAVVLAPAYGKSALLQTLKPVADEMLSIASTYDQEDVSIYLNPTQYRY